MQVKDHTFVVTGGASGLGAGTARKLSELGARVVIADLQDEAGESLAAELKQHYVRCDVSNITDAQRVIDTATQIGSFYGLINCAGIAPAARTIGREAAHDLDLFSKAITVNLIGTFNMNRLAAFAMSKNEALESLERGVLINTASVAAYDGQIGQTAYAASKGGIVSMTLPMARDLAGLGIRCVTIAPGIFGTPMMFSFPQEVQDSLAASIPFPSRLGRPDDYAKLVLSIIDNEMINGETIRLDGAIRMPPR
ncbi:3-hydroxyacyl-CoA dehydrogenase [Paenalcaligenes niemegkensis]|uniref:3-hydroxyacyl-CoA dehydrogenase n=1 Tax=Paenalcaligenes niemegkensis TaxID=2895469 RepID=UPI001EE99789|nr:3-hydroxyacyl-CoA dehydrogenase [Paenalcaligenes niemegkensis]MCQ9616622.1 3-hydroxyacyl-CoA dehydrogenase [Paenalcaligenes niemegkensis]